MVGRSRVAAYADVPVTGARSSARAGCRLVRHRRAVASAGKDGVIQRDHVLLIQRAVTESTHADLVRAVVIDDVVFQPRIRDQPALAVGGGVWTGTREMTRWADDGRRSKIRPQNRAVLLRCHSGDLRVRRCAAVCRAGGPLLAGKGSTQGGEKHP